MSLLVIQDEIRRAISKEQLQDWLKVDSRLAWRHIACDWAGVIMALVAYALCPTWWMLVLSFFSVGFCQYALFILGHDAMHASMLANRRLNDSISRWLIHGPLLMAFDDGKFSHLEHHKLLSEKNDPDRYLHILSNKNSPWKFFLFCAGLATFGKTVLKVTPFGLLLSRPASGTPPEAQAAPATDRAPQAGSVSNALGKYLKNRIPAMVWQPVLIAFLLVGLHLPWWSYFVLWIAPIFFCVFVPDEARAFCDHAVLTLPDDAADDCRLVTYIPSRFETTVFSPHNMNYHAEHHLWPKVPYYNRIKAHQAIASNPRITVHRSYIRFLYSVFSSVPLSDPLASGGVQPSALES